MCSKGSELPEGEPLPGCRTFLTETEEIRKIKSEQILNCYNNEDNFAESGSTQVFYICFMRYYFEILLFCTDTFLFADYHLHFVLCQEYQTPQSIEYDALAL